MATSFAQPARFRRLPASTNRVAAAPDGGVESYTPIPIVPQYSQSNPDSIPRAALPTYTGTDPREMFNNQRQRDQQQQAQFEQEFARDTDQARGERGRYDTLVHDLYNPIWSGGGGYTPEQLAQILQTDQMNSLQWTPEMGAESQLTADEQAGIRNDAYGGFDFLTGQYRDAVEPALAEADSRARTEFGAGAAGQRNAVDQMERDLGVSIDRERLRTDPNYRRDLMNAVSRTRGDVNAAVNDAGLEVDADYTAKGKITDSEVAGLEAAAARETGSAGQAAINDLERQGRAAGSRPEAIAAARGRMLESTQANVADQALRAKLGARQAQIESLRNYSGDSVAAAGQRANLRSNAALALSDAERQAISEAERARIDSERDISNRGMDAASRVGSERIGAERDIMHAGTGLETGIGDRRLNAGMAFTQAGAQLRNEGDARTSQRNAAIADARVNANQYNQQQQWQRGTGISDRASDRWRDAASAWRQDQQEGRGAATQQQGVRDNRVSDTNQQRLQAWQTGSNAGTTNNGQAANYDMARRNSGFRSAFMGSLGNSLGSGIGRGLTGGGLGPNADGGVIEDPMLLVDPETGEVEGSMSEEGPEMIVPMDLERGADRNRLRRLSPSSNIGGRPTYTKPNAEVLKGWSSKQEAC